MEDVDSDEEDFEEPDVAVTEPDELSNSYDVAENKPIGDENLVSQFHGSDGSIWNWEGHAPSTGWMPRKHIVRTDGPKRFILTRANNPIDAFF